MQRQNSPNEYSRRDFPGPNWARELSNFGNTFFRIYLFIINTAYIKHMAEKVKTNIKNKY